MTVTIYLSLIFLVLYLLGLVIHRWIFLRDRRRMETESRGGGRVIAKVDDLTPGSVKKFWLICQKYRLDAFLINDSGSFHAYVNRCRHMPTPLDFVRDEFLSDLKIDIGFEQGEPNLAQRGVNVFFADFSVTAKILKDLLQFVAQLRKH